MFLNFFTEISGCSNTKHPVVTALLVCCVIVCDIGVFVPKSDVKLQPTVYYVELQLTFNYIQGL